VDLPLSVSWVMVSIFPTIKNLVHPTRKKGAALVIDLPKLLHRPRRNRKSEAIRALVQETRLHTSDLIYPLFVLEGEGIREPFHGLPGICRYSTDKLLWEVEKAVELGIPAVALFPVIPREMKDPEGSESTNPTGVLQKAIQEIKTQFPQICVIADVALDPYTSHGHDGLVNEEGDVLNDETVEVLKRMALIQAEAGVDMVAPSDMMDGRIKAIRLALDEALFSQVSIHAYSAKYASAFYGPFRETLDSGLQKGDKKSYQLNPANWREALREGKLDEQEGADILMVKPALPYLDIIIRLRSATSLPISAYQVSGEYAMIVAAKERGWVDQDKALIESCLAIKRAGADMIFTYGAIRLAELITSGALD
jgi:porphobilinogen synthase